MATTRLDVPKAYKLFIDGKFPRSESGRSWPLMGVDGRVVAHVSRASRKDLREAVEAARRAQVGGAGWAGASGMLRGQVLYRLAEMMEGKRAELAGSIAAVGDAAGVRAESKKRVTRGGRRTGTSKGIRPEVEVAAAIDRVVYFAGWCDKFSQVLGCHNPVAGPYYNFTVPEACGVVAVVPPDAFPLLGLVSLAVPALCAGNTVVSLCSGVNPLPAAVLAEALATSDVPPGAVNVLTGERGELVKFIAEHGEIDAVHAANVSADERETLRRGAGENVKRVTVREGVEWMDSSCESPWWIEAFVEMKTIWHPSSA